MSHYSFQRSLKNKRFFERCLYLLEYVFVSLCLANIIHANVEIAVTIAVLEATSANQGNLSIISVGLDTHELFGEQEISLYDEKDIVLSTEASIPAICWLSVNKSSNLASTEQQSHSDHPKPLPFIECRWSIDRTKKIIVIPELVQEKGPIREFHFQIDQFGRNIYWKHQTNRGIWATSVERQESVKIFDITTPKVTGNRYFALDTHNGLLFLNLEHDTFVSGIRLGGENLSSCQAEEGYGNFKGIELDVTNRSLYWQFKDEIHNSNYSFALERNYTSSKKLLLDAATNSMQYHRDYVYLQTPDKTVKRARVTESELKFTAIVDARDEPFSYSVYENRWPNATDPCPPLNCSHLCLPKHNPNKTSSYRCSCPTGMQLIGNSDCFNVHLLFTMNGSVFASDYNRDNGSFVHCSNGTKDRSILYKNVTKQCNIMEKYPREQLQFDPFDHGWTTSEDNCVRFHTFEIPNTAVTLHCLPMNKSLIAFAIDYFKAALVWIEELTHASKPTYYINSIGFDPKRVFTAVRFQINKTPSSLALDPQSSKIFWIKDSQFLHEATYTSQKEGKSIPSMFHVHSKRILRYQAGLLWWTKPAKESSQYSGIMVNSSNEPKAVLNNETAFQNIDNFNVILSPRPPNHCANVECNGVCVPTTTTAICLCPDFTIPETNDSSKTTCRSIEILVSAHALGTYVFQSLDLSNLKNKTTTFQPNVPFKSSPRLLTISSNRDTLCWMSPSDYNIIHCMNSTSYWTMPEVNSKSTFIELDLFGREIFWDSGITGNISVSKVTDTFVFKANQSLISGAHPAASTVDTQRKIFFWAKKNEIHYQTLHNASQAGFVSLNGSSEEITSIVLDIRNDYVYFIQGDRLQRISYKDVFYNSTQTLTVLFKSHHFSNVLQLKFYEGFVLGLIPGSLAAGSTILGFSINDAKLMRRSVPENYALFETYGTVKEESNWANPCQSNSCEYICFPKFSIQDASTEFTCGCPDYKVLNVTTQRCHPENSDPIHAITRKLSPIDFPNPPSTDNVHVTSTKSYETSFNESTDYEQGFEHLTIVILSSGAGILVAIFLSICIWCLICSNRTKKRFPEQILPLAKPANASNNENLIPSSNPAASPNNELPIPLECIIASSELYVDETKVLGSGQFGTVFEGTYRSLPVAVKTLKLHSATSTMTQFRKEVCIIAKIGAHPNVVRYFGTDTADLNNGTIRIVFELSPFGSLLNFLRNYDGSIIQSRDTLTESIQSLPNLALANQASLKQMMLWSNQIARGISFLHEKRIIHGDLATRNVLVFHDSVVKLSDFGFSRSLYNEAVYVKENPDPLPWRWMAVESLKHLQFSTKTDVWSYGVTLWEIFSSGLIPFPQYSWNDRFLRMIEEGKRLPKPQSAPIQVYETVMLPCWKLCPSKRPDFNDLILRLAKIPKVLNIYTGESNYDIPHQLTMV